MEWLNALLPKSMAPSSATADLATPAPGKRTLAQAELAPAPSLADRVIAEAVTELGRLGVRADRIGDPSTLNLTTVRRDLKLLAWIAEGSGRRGAHNRIISAWNAGQDGLDNRDRWPTILHYVRWLDRTSWQSMGMGYDDALAAMPTVRLAGAGVGGKIPVHPRSVYFCAAAQVGMDVRAGIAEGEGHYVPVGGFKNLLKDLKQTLRRIGLGKPFEGARQIVITVHGELTRMVDILAAQDAGVPFGVYRPDEHLEPDLRRKLVPLRESIAAVGTPADDAEATSVAAMLAGILGVAVPDMRELHRNHGSGSVDPHGPGHAMGIAVDMFYGAGDGQYGHQNKGIKSAAWPFIYRLIAEKGAQAGVNPTLRPASLGQLSAEDARGIAKLLHDHGPEFLVEVRDRKRSEDDSAQDRRTYRRFRQLRARAGALLAGREHALASVRGKFRSGDPLRADIASEQHELHADRLRLRAQDPQTVPMTLLACLGRLGALELRVDLALETRTPDLDGLRWKEDHAVGTLLDVVRDLAAIRDDAQPVVERLREEAAIRSAEDPYTKWLVERSAQDDRLLFDQPSVMVEALDEVRTGGSSLQANHHWVVAPTEILESTAKYGDALRSDMLLRHKERTPSQLERVLAVMAESEGGREILTSPQPRPGGIETFHAALADVVGGEAEAEAMVGRVATKAIDPYAGGGKLADLRDRGFYLAGDEGH